MRASGPECEWSECGMHGANDWFGGRSDSHPSDPGVSLMLVSGLFKFTKRRSFCCWCREKARNPFEGVQ